jgi:hypothetical protein
VAQALGCPCGIVLVGLGHVGGHRTMAAFVGRALGAGDALPLGAAFHHRGPQADVQLRAHQRVGHGVGVAFNLHVVIDMDPGELPLRIRLGLRWQGPERWAIEWSKQLLA